MREELGPMNTKVSHFEINMQKNKGNSQHFFVCGGQAHERIQSNEDICV